jgi:anti-anti-sigma factor
VPDQSNPSETTENIITLEQDHLNQIGSCVDVTGKLNDLADENQAQGRCLDVMLDFQWIEKITSIGLNELIKIHTEARRRGISLILGNVPKTVRDVLALTRLERLFEFEAVRVSA